MQTSYDSKLNNATYDALKAFQLNTINSDTSDIANSKLRDIEASANTFFSSIASNFNMAGYNRDILADYVPALVYTMYDGYYIYSPYTNTLDTTNHNEIPTTKEDGTPGDPIIGSDKDIATALKEGSTYQDGEKLSGLKPYIYYSCRYKMNENSNFVITYSLDNYITIQGEINGTWVNDGGYLLDNIEVSSDGKNVDYREVTIDKETKLKETVCLPGGKLEEYEYIKLNGVKYYKDENDNWFSIINGEKLPQEKFDPATTAAIEYYKDANDFKDRVKEYGLGELNAKQAVDEGGSQLKDENGNPKFGDYRIFDFGDATRGSIEDPDSNFNEQRLAVIRYSIEKNLSIAIANYNNYESRTANFMMPKLKEDEWDKIVNNVSIISFLQGLNIGGKIYNGYSIIANNKNKEVVSEDSIYMVTKGEDNNYEYHKPTETGLENKEIIDACLNIDFERRSVTTNNGTTNYFYPKRYNKQVPLGSYTSIVTQTGVEVPNNMYKYMANEDKKNTKLAKKYFTALGRERYGMYKTNNDNETLKKKFGIIREST